MNIQRPPALDDEVSPPRKKVKTVPVRLVPKPERGEPRQGFTKCKLHFEQAKLNTAMQQQEFVTLPLSYFKQLMMEALKNRQTFDQMSCSSQLLKIKIENEDNVKGMAIYKELQNSLSQQSTEQEQAQANNLEKQAVDTTVQFLVLKQNSYITLHPEATRLIKSFFTGDEQQIKCFEAWATSREIRSIDQFQMFLRNPKNEMDNNDIIIEKFKYLFRILLFEYYTKHAFCDIMCLKTANAEELLLLKEKILQNIMIQREYYNFSY